MIILSESILFHSLDKQQPERLCVKEPVLAQFNTLSKANVSKLSIDTNVLLTMFKALHFSEGS
jgi:hypothetical protein